MKRLILLFFLGLTPFVYAQQKKVLLIGIDGLQFEQISKANTPNFDTFTIKRGYNGGIFKTKSQQVTSSGPSWVTILTGVWTDTHKITSNSASQVSAAKSIFRYIKEGNPKLTTASFSTWKNINLLLYKDIYKVNFSTQGGNDKISTEATVNHIKTVGPDFTFIHLDDIDHAGHAYGFGDKYKKAILKVDNQIGQLLQVVQQREKEFNEDWLVMLVTDHGRDKKGLHHGNQTVHEKTIFIGINKKGNALFNSVDNNKKMNSIKELESNSVPQTAVVPTILSYLSIPIKKEWKLDAKALVD
ncbi:MAG: alkaline phosphatase family protein [Flavobacteriaceae bacterium]|nr:alkaline phosphatase family protein [Flavobacteriaceae bacterium]